MRRFVKYDRIELTLNQINKMSDNIVKRKINIRYFTSLYNFGFFSERSYNPYLETKYMRQCFPIIGLNIDKIYYVKYTIKLDIPIDFFNSEEIFCIYNKLRDTSDMKIRFYTYNNSVRRLVYGIKNSRDISLHNYGRTGFFNFIGNEPDIYYDNINTILLILSYCINLLKSKDIRDTIFLTIENDMDKIKKIIIIFYYLFIYLMIFQLGTAAIAEISLFTLWDTYVNFDGNEPLILNKNTMLDVEVLTLHFSTFYNNCFNQESEENIYTPYFINLHKHN